MNWYYAVGEERKGPVSELELQGLVQQGVITQQTLVWRDGLPGWLPYSGTVAPALDSVACSACKNVFQKNDVIPLAGGMFCAACKPVALQRLKEGVSSNSDVEAMRNTHLQHEASVRSVGMLYYLGGVAMVLGGVAVAVGSVFASSGSRAQGEVVGMLVVGLLVAALGGGQFWVGRGLRRLESWARTVSAILCGIGLLGFPVGTLINGYILYLLWSAKGKTIFTAEYRSVVEQTPHMKYKTSVVVWVVLGVLVLLVLAGIFAAVWR